MSLPIEMLARQLERELMRQLNLFAQGPRAPSPEEEADRVIIEELVNPPSSPANSPRSPNSTPAARCRDPGCAPGQRHYPRECRAGGSGREIHQSGYDRASCRRSRSGGGPGGGRTSTDWTSTPQHGRGVGLAQSLPP